MRRRIEAMRARLERLLLWRVWERMLEIEFVDRSVALAGKAFVSFFPLVIVVAAFVPDRIRSSIITTVTARLGIEGDALDARPGRPSHRPTTSARRPACSGSCSRSSSPRSFTTALQRVYLRAWRRPTHARTRRVLAWRGLAAGGAGVHGAARRVSAASSAVGSDSASSPSVARGDVGAVVVHRLVPAAGRGAGAGARPDRR